MIGSTGRRWKLNIIAGAGLACLGAGTLAVSGCSTATVSDSRTTGKSNQQIAKAKKPATGKSASKQVASRGAPGKVRITDLDEQDRDYLSSQVAQNKAEKDKALASARAAASAAASATVANNVAKRTPAPQQRQAPPRITPQTVAQRRPATSSQPQPRASAVASNTRASTGSITQTSGNRSASAAVRAPVITPRQTEWKEEGAPETANSNHERRRADRLMQRAYAMYASGYREEALRLASVAAELEHSQLAVYKRGEERPSDFVEFLVLTTKTNKPYSTIEVPPRYRLQQPDASRGPLSAVTPAAAESARTSSVGSSTAPRFATVDTVDSQSAANAGQLEIPASQAARKAEVSVVTVDGSGATSAEAVKEEPQSVVTADQLEQADEQAAGANVIAANAPDPAAVAAPEAEIEPAVEADAPTVAPNHRSQLTIASLIGLVIGVAGMVGLGWWRRQERQHYAAGK